ncbi:uncharacterized protein LOC123954685 [Meles meles]|uniref:uncharacterized protein LOC123954685 n=1 Tax=Meles meles TaxID=9662 RepID=UPI001E69C48C|nr:uncharacterized protein LOC123954685 [Meles meles]
MPPGEGQGRGRVSAGEGGGGRPAGSPASSSRAGGGACPRRLLPLGSAPALEARVRVGASKRVCSPSSSLSPVVRTGLGRRRLSGFLASRCGPSGWERRRSARAGRRRLRAPRRAVGRLWTPDSPALSPRGGRRPTSASAAGFLRGRVERVPAAEVRLKLNCARGRLANSRRTSPLLLNVGGRAEPSQFYRKASPADVRGVG